MTNEDFLKEANPFIPNPYCQLTILLLKMVDSTRNPSLSIDKYH